MNNATQSQPKEIVITALGLITGAAKTRAELAQAVRQGPVAAGYELKTFEAAPHLSNRKLLKTVSWYHGVGLAALEECRRDGTLSPGDYPAEQLGLFVGAPPSSCYDNTNYLKAVEAARLPSGVCSDQLFGSTSQLVLGTTLLKGLPNNVLCYGSIIADAKGPNSNYIAGEVSGHLSLIAAARNLRHGRLKAAIAGAYAHPTDAVVNAMRFQNGRAKTEVGQESHIAPFGADGDSGTVCADGSVFVILETRAGAEARGAKVLATLVSAATTASGSGPLGDHNSSAAAEALAYAMKDALVKGGLAPSDVGAVFVSGSGVTAEDEIELGALALVFGAAEVKPAVVCLAPVFGNLMEAGGLMELGLWSDLLSAGAVPAPISLSSRSKLVAAGFTEQALSPARTHALVVRAGQEGDFSALLINAAT